MITIVPLGPGDPKYLTEESQHTLLTASNLVLRTSRHPVRSFLEAHAVPFTSLDDLYDEAEDFDELNQAIVHHLLKLSGQENLVYAVSDPQTDVSVRLLRSRKAMNIRVLPGVPLSNWYLSALPAGFSCTAHLMTGAALDLVPSRTDCDLLLTELHTRELAGLVKLQLADLYPDEYQVVLFSDFSSHASLEAQVIPLFDLDRQKHYDHLSALYVPALLFDEKVQHTPEIMRYTVHDLMDVTSTLRSPDGCPWDREQTHQSLRPYLLEEAYEADTDALIRRLLEKKQIGRAHV